MVFDAVYEDGEEEELSVKHVRAGIHDTRDHCRSSNMSTAEGSLACYDDHKWQIVHECAITIKPLLREQDFLKQDARKWKGIAATSGL